MSDGFMQMFLQMNEVEIYDGLWSPFSTLTDTLSFLSINKTQFNAVDMTGMVVPFFIEFFIDTEVKKQTRSRYNFWQALGDIGGIHDGFNLLISLFMSRLSAAFFFSSFVNGQRVGPKHSKQQKL